MAKTTKPKTTKPKRESVRPAAPRAPRAPRAKRVEASEPVHQASRVPWMSLLGVIAGAVGLVAFGAYVFSERAEQARHVPESEVVQSLTTVVPERLVARVHARHPHRPDAFTQGLVWERGRLFESTGLEGASTLREVALDSGDVTRSVTNPSDVFAEGLALVGNRLVQLTWQDNVAFVYDRDSFTKLTEHRYEGEGWGLCHDGSKLVMSDGSDVLRFRDPETFAVTRSVSVTRLGRPLRMLNELECVGDEVYANVWQTNDIVRIDAATGVVEAIIDATELAREVERADVYVLNGIAYMPESRRFLVTGKHWPTMFEVTFERARP